MEHFINEAQRKAIRANVVGEELRLAIIAGLRPNIRMQVNARKPESVNDIRKFGIEAEASEDAAIDLPKLAPFKRLEEKVDKLHVVEMRTAKRQPPGGGGPSLGPTGSSWGCMGCRKSGSWTAWAWPNDSGAWPGFSGLLRHGPGPMGWPGATGDIRTRTLRQLQPGAFAGLRARLQESATTDSTRLATSTHVY